MLSRVWVAAGEDKDYFTKCFGDLTMKYCTRCGNELKDDDIFCGKCGHKQDSHTTENKQEEFKNLNRNDNSDSDSNEKKPKDNGRKKEKGPRKRIHAKSVWALIFAILSLLTRGAALISLFFGFMAVLFILLDLIFHGKKRTRNHVLSFIALGVIIFSVVGLNIIHNGIMSKQKTGEAEFDISEFAETISDEELKNTESDITGLSLFDKIEMGLDFYNGSDTDNDGLTDKEEIEVYNSDPLKMSTSGDLIPDSYKIAMGLEINSKYNMEDYEFEQYGLTKLYSAPDNITIDTTNVENAFSSICERNKIYKGMNPLIGFDLVNVTGTTNIDFSDYMEDNKDYTVILQKNIDESESIELENGIAKIDTDGDYINVSLFNSEDIEGYNDAIVFLFTGLVGVIDDIRNFLTSKEYVRNVYIFEKKENDKNIDRSEAISIEFEKAFPTVPIDIHHKYVSKFEYGFLKLFFGSIFAETKEADEYFTSSLDPNSSDFYSKYLKKLLFEKYYVYQQLREEDWFLSEATLWGICQNNFSEQDYLTVMNYPKSQTIPVSQSYTKKIAKDFDLIHDTFGFSNGEAGAVTNHDAGICYGFSKIIASRFNGEPKISKTDNNSYPYDVSDPKYNSLFDKNICLHYDFYVVGDLQVDLNTNWIIKNNNKVCATGKIYGFDKDGAVYEDIDRDYNLSDEEFKSPINDTLFLSDTYGNRVFDANKNGIVDANDELIKDSGPRKHAIVEENVANLLTKYQKDNSHIVYDRLFHYFTYDNNVEYLFQDYSEIDALEDYLNEGNIALVNYMHIKKGCSFDHTNIVYGIEETEDSNVKKLLIYENCRVCQDASLYEKNKYVLIEKTQKYNALRTWCKKYDDNYYDGYNFKYICDHKEMCNESSCLMVITKSDGTPLGNPF